MDFIVDSLHKGGPFMWPLLLAIPVTIVLAVVRARTLQSRSFPGLGLALVTCLLATGVLGAAQGDVMCYQAVAGASEAIKPILLENGLAISVVPLKFAVVLAIIVGVIFGGAWQMSKGTSLPAHKWSRKTLQLSRIGAGLAVTALALFFLQRGHLLGESTSAQTLSQLLQGCALASFGGCVLGLGSTIGAVACGFGDTPAAATSTED